MLFAKLQEVNYILRESDKWVLTAKGKLAGGRIKTSAKLGDYIEWPENFDLALLPVHQSPDVPIELVSSTKIGNELGISANKLNFLFSELGWVGKSLKGWVATDQGLKQGAVQSEDSRSGIPFVKWPEAIVKSKHLISSVNDITGSNIQPLTNSHDLLPKPMSIEIRDKVDALHKATDGHFVRSKAEMLIDNWRYMAEIPHAYEHQLPFEENVNFDLVIQTGHIYTEKLGNGG